MKSTNDKHTTLIQQLATIPTTPGIYKFLDANGEILYVGKAKVLRPRVNSYFRQSAALDPAKQQMIPKIASVATISTDNETEALVLEANLIRKHQPPYNVVLRDDKYYLFIKITTNEEFPRVFPVRKINQDKARYFGPYSSARSVRHTLKLLRRIFPHRGEKDSPTDQIFPHPLFDLRSKSVPHSLRQKRSDGGPPPDQYQKNISNIIHFLQGHRSEIANTLRTGMKQASSEKKYEQAAIWRDQLRAIDRLEGTQKVYLPRPESFDVISLAQDKTTSAGNVFQIRQGKLLNKHTFLLTHRQSAPTADILRQFMLQYYSVAQDIPKLIIIPTNLDDETSLSHWINQGQPPQLHVPVRGTKKQLLALGELNAQQLLDQETTAFESAGLNRQALQELARALKIAPANAAGHSLRRVEVYDISNIQGKLPTGSMIVFTDGQPDKARYRKFSITGDDTPDDFRMLQEVLRRRLRHADWPLPDLILIDGGKGQLNAIKKILSELNLPVPLASIAKREEEIFIPNQSEPIRLPYDSPALHLIQRMRDEAHRFTISYHRLLRSKQFQRSLLDEVPGIGPATKSKLLNHFGSLRAIKAAPDQQLTAVIGATKTATLRDYL